MTGCRWGELVALRRHRVDPLHGRLQIVEQLVEVEGGHISVGPPKTSAGVRQVSIPPHLLPALVEHMAAYSEQTPDGLLFTGPKGAYLTRRNFTVTWTKAKNKAGVDAGLHFHDLSHLAATLAAGVPGTTTKDLSPVMATQAPERRCPTSTRPRIATTLWPSRCRAWSPAWSLSRQAPPRTRLRRPSRAEGHATGTRRSSSGGEHGQANAEYASDLHVHG